MCEAWNDVLADGDRVTADNRPGWASGSQNFRAIGISAAECTVSGLGVQHRKIEAMLEGASLAVS